MKLSWLFGRGMSCHEVMEVLQSYLDGETDAGTARRVAGHLDGCRHCDHESHIYERIKISLRQRRTAIDPVVAAALHDYIGRLARGDVPGAERGEFG